MIDFAIILTMKKIVVLMGGTSHERGISLESGRNVAKALASLNKYEVLPLELDRDDLATLPADTAAVYIALHGGWGENGGVQAALDARAIPYTGPGARASRAAMDKIETKKILAAHGVPTAPWQVVREGETATTSPFGYPVVVKVPRDGSSVGVYLAKDDAAYQDALARAFALDDGAPGAREALVEAYIPGREMTVGVIGEEALPAIEIIARDGWYGFEEKYNSNETRYPFLADSPNPADAELEARLQALARAAFQALGCRGVSRVDFRITPDGTIYVLELNTSPGFTSHSLVPKSGMRTGLTFAQVCEKILLTAQHD